MEADNEVSGTGNSLDYGYRKMNPRLGRWMTCDPLRFVYPSMSPYCYAANSPISCKDPDGKLVIFINGYTGQWGPGECPALKPYWGNEFLSAAGKYFNDENFVYEDGSGSWCLSTASDRQEYGEHIARMHVEAIRKALNTDGETIKIVSHSMGAAFAEGYIKELMNYPDIANRIDEIVHFSPCDANDIEISENSKHITRTQINIQNDFTLWFADFFSIGSMGGYEMQGVNYFKVIPWDLKKLHKHIVPWYKPWAKKKLSGNLFYDPHYDTKNAKWVWDTVKDLKIHENRNTGPFKVNLDFITNPNSMFNMKFKEIFTNKKQFDDGIYDENDKPPTDVS